MYFDPLTIGFGLTVGAVSALVCAFLAKEKNRDVGTFAIVGLIFGVFGILYAGLAPEGGAAVSSNDDAPAMADRTRGGTAVPAMLLAGFAVLIVAAVLNA